MKKQISFLILSLILIFITSFLFITSIALLKEGDSGQPYFTIFILAVCLNFFYYLWLTLTNRLNYGLAVFYVPTALVLFIVFCFLIAKPPWLKEIKFDMGPDPFAPSTAITSGMVFTIWQKEFWSKSAREEYRLNEFKNLQTERQGSLIGHIGDNLQGWNEEKIKNAFGDPAKIIQVNESLKKWIYHPWTDHPDWEMPVYVQDGVLFKIGD